jgi:hypothetical protein
MNVYDLQILHLNLVLFFLSVVLMHQYLLQDVNEHLPMFVIHLQGQLFVVFDLHMLILKTDLQ